MTNTQHTPGPLYIDGQREGEKIRVSNTLDGQGNKCVLIRANGAPFTPEYSAEIHLTPQQAGNLAFNLMSRASSLGCVDANVWHCEPSRHPDYANRQSNLFADGVVIANINWRSCLPNERLAYDALITQAPTLLELLTECALVADIPNELYKRVTDAINKAKGDQINA